MRHLIHRLFYDFIANFCARNLNSVFIDDLDGMPRQPVFALGNDFALAFCKLIILFCDFLKVQRLIFCDDLLCYFYDVNGRARADM